MEPYKLPACAENDLVKTSHNMIEVNPFKTHPSGQKYQKYHRKNRSEEIRAGLSFPTLGQRMRVKIPTRG